jgi:rifampicin phosphotransferase
MVHVLALAECSPDRAAEVGGKTKGLHALISLGLPVPPGFAITAEAYRDVLRSTGVQGAITEVLNRPGLSDDKISAEIFAIFTSVTLPAALATEIDSAYADLGEGPVAVRSSGVAEDTAAASFAGQHDTYLWVTGAESVRAHVLRCWASLFNAGAIGYRKRFEIPPSAVAMGVVVQRMVPATAAGVMMTLEPVTGDRTQIYIESAHGLGEGVVVGDVDSDRFWVDKATLQVAREEISVQAKQYAFDEALGGVSLQEIDKSLGEQPSLTSELVCKVAGLGRRVEEAFEAPMDVEWAVSPDGDVLLLQARPETVWSNRPQLPEPGTAPDTLHGASRPQSWWTRTNVAETIPGVQTPLGWSVWADAGESGMRRCFKQLGALSAAEAKVPARNEDRFIGIFLARPALQLDLICDWADRIIGISGEAMAMQSFSFVPPDYVSRPKRRYYPRVALHLPSPLVIGPRKARKDRAAAEKFWQQTTHVLPALDRKDALALLDTSIDQFAEVLYGHLLVQFGAVQSAYDILSRVCAGTGVQPQALMMGHGQHEETACVTDMWDCSRGRLSTDEFLARHGYHGPDEGELTATVWRENPAPVIDNIERYRRLDESADPRQGEIDRAKRRVAGEAELLRALPAWKRPMGKFALAFAAKYLPLRGVSKAGFLMALDAARACSRRVGELLVADDVIDTVDDVFYLTLPEAHNPPPSAKDLVAVRRALGTYYRQLTLPQEWQGVPSPFTVEIDPDAELITGIPASPGVIEGRVRVIADPSQASVEPGEILVAENTDPSWASIMFLSSGLIADIGGIISHTAVVARELSIPCVVSTQFATKVLHTGDLIRMDGGTGHIQILQRAPVRIS